MWNNSVDVYGIDRNEPYVDIRVSADEEGVELVKSIMTLFRGEAIRSLENDDAQKALRVITLYSEARECLDRIEAEKNEEAEPEEGC